MYLFVLLLWSFQLSQPTPTEAPTFHIGVCTSFSASSASFMAPYVASEAFRKRVLMTPKLWNFTIKLHYRRRNDKEGKIAVDFAKSLDESEPIRAVIGCSSSVSSKVLVPIVNAFNIPVISAVSNSLDLDDLDRYPYFMRIVATDNSLIIATGAFIANFGWKRIFTMTQSSERWKEFEYNLRLASPAVTWHSSYYDSYDDSVYRVSALHAVNVPYYTAFMEDIKALDPRIIIRIGLGGMLIHAFLYDAGFYQAKHMVLNLPCINQDDNVWPFGPFFDDVNMTAAAIHGTEDWWNNHTQSVMSASLDGLLTFCTASMGSFQHSVLEKMWANITTERFVNDIVISSEDRAALRVEDEWFVEGLLNSSRFRTSFTRRFDATTVVIYAISDLLQSGLAPDLIAGQTLYRTMLKQNFKGLAGDISFDDIGNWDATIAIDNARDGFWKKAGLFNVGQGLILQNVTWPGGGQHPPLDQAEPCSAGLEYNLQSRACKPCDIGRFLTQAQAEAMLPCQACPKGYTSDTGEFCVPCPSGRFSQENTSCMSCHLGTFTALPGNTACLECDMGKYSQNQGSSECMRCRQGSFTNMTGASACLECPPQWTTGPDSSLTSLRDCVCPPGTYWPGGGANCVACPLALQCPGGHAYLDSFEGNFTWDVSPLVREGFMTLPDDPYSAYTCVEKNICDGSRCLPVTSSCEQAMCDGFFFGPRCSKCPSGWYPTDESCEKCANHAFLDAFKLFILYMVQFLVWLWMFRKSGRPKSEMSFVIGQFVVYIQLLSVLFTMRLEWPLAVRWLVTTSKPASLQGVWDILLIRRTCIFGSGFLSRALREVLIPLLPFLNGVLWTLIGIALHRPVSQPRVRSATGYVFGGLFIAITRTALMLFPCDVMPNDTCFLQAFPDVKRGSEEWLQAVPSSAIAVVLYCGGFVSHVVRLAF